MHAVPGSNSITPCTDPSWHVYAGQAHACCTREQRCHTMHLSKLACVCRRSSLLLYHATAVSHHVLTQAGICVQDKINAFWEINKKELEDTRAQLRNKDREMEETEERHEVEIKVQLAL